MSTRIESTAAESLIDWIKTMHLNVWILGTISLASLFTCIGSFQLIYNAGKYVSDTQVQKSIIGELLLDTYQRLELANESSTNLEITKELNDLKLAMDRLQFSAVSTTSITILIDTVNEHLPKLLTSFTVFVASTAFYLMVWIRYYVDKAKRSKHIKDELSTLSEDIRVYLTNCVYNNERVVTIESKSILNARTLEILELATYVPSMFGNHGKLIIDKDVFDYAKSHSTINM